MSLPQAVVIKQGTDFVSKHPYITAGIVAGAIAIGGLIFYYYIYKPLKGIGKSVGDIFSGQIPTPIAGQIASPSAEAFLLSNPFTLPLGLVAYGEKLLNNLFKSKPESYTAPALTKSYQQAYQEVGIANPQQYLQGLQTQVQAEAPSTYQQGQYVGYGAE